jgi:potassium-transporting ATPase KdpC subunit
MRTQLRPALISLISLSILTGLIYPFLITGIAQWIFPRQANGSLILHDGRALGSELIGQPFSDSKYFWGRLSATGTFPYNAYNAESLTASSGSNYGPLNPALLEVVQGRVEALKSADPGNNNPIPVDLVTASGSGLDPHISLAAAYYQIPRVAKARGLSEGEITSLVEKYTEGRQIGILGEPRVNVLLLNLALDDLQ